MAMGRRKEGLLPRERDDLFRNTFLSILHEIYPDDSDENFDERRIGEMKYVTLYDLIR